MIKTIRTFLLSLGLDAQYYRIMLKAMGIVMVTQLAVQACQDMDAPSIARRAAFCGRIALLGVAVPVFMELTQMAVDVLR
ncbi:MAG: SpoIIIAC/SpoIIIAD family protein [Candidatus Ventricola sp.]